MLASPLLIFCSLSIFLLATLVTGRRPHGPSILLVQTSRECSPPINWNIKSSPASLGRSRVGPALYVFSLLDREWAFNIPAWYTCTVNTSPTFWPRRSCKNSVTSTPYSSYHVTRPFFPLPPFSKELIPYLTACRDAHCRA